MPIKHAATKELKSMMDELPRLSNAGNRPASPRKLIYGSFHHSLFTNTEANRNTMFRMNRCAVPGNLKGVKVLELASNVGAISLELARRGAEVTGIEYDKERCKWCNKLAGMLDLNAKFYQGNLDMKWPNGIEDQKYDFVVCAAVDHYLRKKDALFEKLKQVSGGNLWLELNDKSPNRKSVEDVMAYYAKKFRDIMFYGMDGGRRVFMMGGKGPWPIYFGSKKYNTIYQDGMFVKNIDNRRYKFMKWAYEQVKHIPYVVPMDFSEKNKMKSMDMRPFKFVGKKLSGDELRSCKRQLISFVREMSKVGMCHGDLYNHNMALKDGRLYIIDWETVFVHVAPIQNHWDINGRYGVGSRVGVGPIFSKRRADRIKAGRVGDLSAILDLSPSDFLGPEIIPLA